MQTTKALALTFAGAAALFTTLAGCNNERTTSTTSRTEEAVIRKPSISISGPGHDLLVGDTAGFVATSTNTYGRDAKIKWSSTGGKITTDGGGSVAHVRFDNSGTYTVKATLEVDGAPLQTESVDVHVNPVKQRPHGERPAVRPFVRRAAVREFEIPLD